MKIADFHLFLLSANRQLLIANLKSAKSVFSVLIRDSDKKTQHHLIPKP